MNEKNIKVSNRDVPVRRRRGGEGTPVLLATRWYVNGDLPDDLSRRIEDSDGNEFLTEGMVVRRFRRPDIPGYVVCTKCGSQTHYHGWIDPARQEGEEATVCPGDWVLTGPQTIFVVEPGRFAFEYERVTPGAP